MEFVPKYGASPLFEHHTTSLVFNDPPLHTRVRRLIAGALTPRAHRGDGAAAGRALVDSLLDRMAERERREIDLIDDFAAAIPVEIIGNLLGVPARGARAAARLVARDPRRPRARADAASSCERGEPARCASSSPISRASSSAAAPSPATRRSTC